MTIYDKKLSNPGVSCVNRELTQNAPTLSIAPIHADEITMNANARKQRRGFDSYPLRHLHLRFTIDDLRFVADPLVNRKSQILNSTKGGGSCVAQTAP
jgi:hypothetical protein